MCMDCAIFALFEQCLKAVILLLFKMFELIVNATPRRAFYRCLVSDEHKLRQSPQLLISSLVRNSAPRGTSRRI